MALRVLLGDESSTIKKVFQLALQDFAVEVRPVNIGVDVVTVAQSFNPDIIFIDVLLQKKNGYEVSSELKSNDGLRHIPVVLMWSGFMELDEDKFEASMANGQLEKPFDVGALRKLVADLVPKTSSQRLSQFLTFPKMPELEEPTPQAPPAPEPAEADEDFKQVSIPKMKKAGDEKFRLNMKPEELDPDSVPVDYSVPGEREESDDFSMSRPAIQREAAPPPAPAPAPTPAPAMNPAPAPRAAAPAPAPAAPAQPAYNARPTEIPLADLEMEDLVEVPLDDERTVSAETPALIATSGLNAQQLEKIIRDQSADVIESVVWKVVPELAKQIIERELNKLLSERDSRHP